MLERCKRWPGKLRHARPRDGVELPPGPIRGDAWPQPSYHVQVMTPLLAFVVAEIPSVVLHGRPDLRGRRQDVLESARHHADDSVQIAVQRDPASYDGAFATEAPFPQCVAQDRQMRTFEAVVGWLEVPPQRWRHPQRAEVAGADALPIESFRLGRASPVG